MAWAMLVGCSEARDCADSVQVQQGLTAGQLAYMADPSHVTDIDCVAKCREAAGLADGIVADCWMMVAGWNCDSADTGCVLRGAVTCEVTDAGCGE